MKAWPHSGSVGADRVGNAKIVREGRSVRAAEVSPLSTSQNPYLPVLYSKGEKGVKSIKSVFPDFTLGNP